MSKTKLWTARFFTILTMMALLIFTACTVLPEEGQAQEGQMPMPKTLTDPRGIELYSQIQKSVAGREDVLAFIVFDVSIDHVQYSKDGTLALVWVALVDKEKGFVQPGEPGLVIAQKTADLTNPWQLTFQADANFAQVLMAVPDEMLSPEDKQHYMPAVQQADKAASIFHGYRLPWTNGETVRLSGSIGHVYTYKSCPNDCLYAFDFANGTMFPVRAARQGRVKYAVWQYENGNTTNANYIVLEDTSTSPTTYQVYLHLAQNSIPAALRVIGTPVVQGQFLGNADDTGYSTGHHLHFHVHTSTTTYWGRSVDITFDDVSINGGRPRMCSEAQAFPQFGTECMPNDRYVSRNSDAEPPTGGISSPAAYSKITAPTLNVSGWMKDDVGVASAQLMYTVAGDWKPIGNLQTTTPFTTQIDLCQARIPDGKFFLSIVVRDQAGKTSVGTQGLTELVKSYKCPPLPPVCVPTETQAALFSDIEFQGNCQILEKGEYSDMNALPQVKANAARSILVGSGVSALLYPDAGFQGTVELIQDGDDNLADNPIGDANAASIKVVQRIVPPTPPSITLPLVITADTLLTAAWSTEAGVDTRATLNGGNGYTNALDWQTGGSWEIGKLAEGEYSLAVEAVNLAGSASVTQPFTVMPGVVPPVSSMEALPQISNSTAVTLKWKVESGEDDVDHFNLQWRAQGGEWQDWSEPLARDARQVLFWGTPDSTFEYRMRAVDLIGTTEAYPDAAEVSTFINPGCMDDEYEGVAPGDDEQLTAAPAESGVTQTHNWCPLGDVDWVAFQALQGETYSLVSKAVGNASAAGIELYDTNGTTLLGKVRPASENSDTRLEWIVPLDGVYYIKLTPADARIGGQETTYEFTVQKKSSVEPGALICGSALIPALLGGGYAVSKQVQKRKKSRGVGW